MYCCAAVFLITHPTPPPPKNLLNLIQCAVGEPFCFCGFPFGLTLLIYLLVPKHIMPLWHVDFLRHFLWRQSMSTCQWLSCTCKNFTYAIETSTVLALERRLTYATLVYRFVETFPVCEKRIWLLVKWLGCVVHVCKNFTNTTVSPRVIAGEEEGSFSVLWSFI